MAAARLLRFDDCPMEKRPTIKPHEHRTYPRGAPAQQRPAIAATLLPEDSYI